MPEVSNFMSASWMAIEVRSAGREGLRLFEAHMLLVLCEGL